MTAVTLTDSEIQLLVDALQTHADKIVKFDSPLRASPLVKERRLEIRELILKLLKHKEDIHANPDETDG
jgi:hypothetical protein